VGDRAKRGILTTAAWIIVGGVALYLAMAYVLLPALWTHREHQPGLAPGPFVTTTPQGIPGDPVNIGLVGSRHEVIGAMAAAGWHPADPITIESSAEIGLSVVLHRPYQDAPVSTLMYRGRRQDLAFERAVGTSAAHRHHVRLWQVLAQGVEGRPVWLGAASFDRSVGISHRTGQITHHIDPDLDAERQFLIDSLTGAGLLAQTYQVTGTGPTLAGRNGGGDRYFTDGEICLGVLRPDLAPSAVPPEHRPSSRGVAFKQRVWRALAGAVRALPFTSRS
jgi:hypothetical protein